MPTALINGVELFHEVIGSGRPLLMMHGNGVDHTCLRPYHDALARDARVIYYDHRWNGRSERRGPADHATWHADAAALLDHLGESRATIYGHSYGSWLALGFALRYPERVDALILCATSPAFDYTDEVVATAQARDPIAAAALVEGLAHGVSTDEELATLWSKILPLYFHGPGQREVLARTVYSAPGFSLAMAALDGFSVVEQLPTLRVPTLVLVGRDDYITPPTQARRLASLTPDATVVEFASSGHFPFVEEPDEYLGAIRSWWPASS
jgi:proline iminopeptidase